MTTLKQRNNAPLKIHQDDFSPGKGNALQAAVASVFGLQLSEVPNFTEMPEGYEAVIRKFCQEGGSDCVKVPLKDDSSVVLSDDYEQKLCIVRGKSPRGDFGHVVVAKVVEKKFEMMHDPHPDGTFLDEQEKFGW
eukprot:CAMPEP_0194213520 /NCGR_PEP_ID=MMETSP0156-20130528/14191_1 /TAXON_ID=33649 /ORGANISM="Thalassionema nitzschioides, Strain L26-B" /LENGTH=134 /DNA_ID=CAMNT_0038941573 /DNA_START=122 /DNA_END=523 /DNA_ORIENTATION=+